ncbi:MAG TPA: hemolysin family protein [Rectinemataceae bacterium]
MLGELLLILGLILLNGLFSLSEMALVSARKARLRHEAEQGKEAYRLALEAAENPGRFLSAIQVAITLIGILTGAVGGATISGGLSAWLASFPGMAAAAGPLSVGIVVVLTTLVSVVLGELVPKDLALSRPEALAAAAIRPLRAVSIAFYPLVRLLSWTTSLVVKAFGLSKKDLPEVTEDEVKVLIARGEETGVFEKSEREMVEGVLDLDDRRVTSFMTPRTEVEAIDLDGGDEESFRTLLTTTQHAYLPVCEGDLDRIVGMLPVRGALASLVSTGACDPRSHLVQPVLIPETISALKALAIMRDEGARTALIVDEYGGVAGLVTLGDLLGQVLSGFDEEADSDQPGLVRREDGSWLVDGALSVSDFVEALELDESALDAKGYDTVAGLVLDCMGSIPKAGDRCTWDGLNFEIVDMDGRRIDKVLVSRTPEDFQPESGV